MTNRELIITAFDKGYRVVNGKVISPRGNNLSLYYSKKSRFSYLSFGLRSESCVRRICVHQLIGYQKFGNQMFENSMLIRHKDGNRFNNLEDNILIGTQSQNMLDMPPEIRITKAINAATVIRKVSDVTILEIREKHNNGATYKELMEEYTITSKGTMSHIINNDYVTVK